jgi:hypothetical protein
MNKELELFLKDNGATENHKKILAVLGIKTLEEFKNIIFPFNVNTEVLDSITKMVPNSKTRRKILDHLAFMAYKLRQEKKDENEETTLDDIVEFFDLSLAKEQALKKHFASIFEIASASYIKVARLLFDATLKTYDFDPDSARREAREIIDWCRDDAKAYGRRLRERKSA